MSSINASPEHDIRMDTSFFEDFSFPVDSVVNYLDELATINVTDEDTYASISVSVPSVLSPLSSCQSDSGYESVASPTGSDIDIALTMHQNESSLFKDVPTSVPLTELFPDLL